MEGGILQAPGGEEFAWQQERRRQDGHFDVPVSGFGPQGQHCLWLPSPRQDVRIVYFAGEPVRELVPSCMTEPAIADRRRLAMKELALTDGLRMLAGMSFFRYAAAVVLRNYRLTDAELGMVLSGTAWHQGVMEHLAGGDDVLALVLELSPRVLPMPAAPTPPTAAPRRGWVARLLGR
jgi:hypothetical protein